MKAEINKQIELVQILMYLAEEQEKTEQCLNNKTYLKNIFDWFEKYKDHAAVRITKKLITEKHFFHTRPLKAILNLKNIFIDDSHELHLWAIETTRFARESNFDDFFLAQNEYYVSILDRINSCEFDTWISYIENYFKSAPDEFHLIICPIAGNYGFNIMLGEKKIAYTIRYMPYYDEAGNPEWKFDFFAKGIAHEYAHCFVNPIVEESRELLKKYTRFFEVHTNMPTNYNVDYAVINEYFVRAFQIRFMEKNHTLFPKFDILLEYERQRDCFIFIDDFVNVLKAFENSGMAFSEFYKQNIEEILSKNNKPQKF